MFAVNSKFNGFIKVGESTGRRALDIYQNIKNNDTYYVKEVHNIAPALNQLVSSKIFTLFLGEDIAPQDILIKDDEGNVYIASKEIKDFHSLGEVLASYETPQNITQGHCMLDITMKTKDKTFYKGKYSDNLKIENIELVTIIATLIGDYDLHRNNVGYVPQGDKAQFTKIDGDLSLCFSEYINDEYLSLDYLRTSAYNRISISPEYFRFSSQEKLKESFDLIPKILNPENISEISHKVVMELEGAYGREKIESDFQGSFTELQDKLVEFIDGRVELFDRNAECAIEAITISELAKILDKCILEPEYITAAIISSKALNLTKCSVKLKSFDIHHDQIIKKNLGMLYIDSIYARISIYSNLMQQFSIEEILEFSNQSTKKVLEEIAITMIVKHDLKNLEEFTTRQELYSGEILKSLNNLCCAPDGIELLHEELVESFFDAQYEHYCMNICILHEDL
jgi:hypothetical protein